VQACWEQQSSNISKGSVMKTAAAVLLAALMGMLAGCNTVEGAGKT
jgi:hypothetical protein